MTRKLQCGNCQLEFQATNPQSKFCSSTCRQSNQKKKRNIGKTCIQCNIDISNQPIVKKFCSEECMIKHRLAKVNKGIPGIDYIVCPLCFRHVKQISNAHAKMHGFVSPTEMAKTLEIETTCQALKDKVTGENNPGFNHQGKYSKFSKNFIHGYDKEWHNNHNEQNKLNRKKHPERYINNLEYWMEKANSIEEAKELHKKFQTRDLAFFIDKYGEELGKQKHLTKTEKWLKSYKKSNFSKVSQELFNHIIESCQLDHEHIYFATFDREDMREYKNKEHRLKLDNMIILPDFIDLNTKRIIEFDGTYWHEIRNQEKEIARNEQIKNAGYDVLYVREQDYYNNKNKVIQECIYFLTK